MNDVLIKDPQDGVGMLCNRFLKHYFSLFNKIHKPTHVSCRRGEIKFTMKNLFFYYFEAVVAHIIIKFY